MAMLPCKLPLINVKNDVYKNGYRRRRYTSKIAKIHRFVRFVMYCIITTLPVAFYCFFSCESTAEWTFSVDSTASRLPTLPRFTGHPQNSSLCLRMYKRAIVTYVYQSTVQNIVQSVWRYIS